MSIGHSGLHWGHGYFALKHNWVAYDFLSELRTTFILFPSAASSASGEVNKGLTVSHGRFFKFMWQNCIKTEIFNRNTIVDPWNCQSTERAWYHLRGKKEEIVSFVVWKRKMFDKGSQFPTGRHEGSESGFAWAQRNDWGTCAYIRTESLQRLETWNNFHNAMGEFMINKSSDAVQIRQQRRHVCETGQ